MACVGGFAGGLRGVFQKIFGRDILLYYNCIMNEEKYTVDEFSRKTGVPIATVYKSIRDGKIAVERGRRRGRLNILLIPESELKNYK